MKRGKQAAAVIMVWTLAAGAAMQTYGAESTFAMKKKAVSLLGILTTSRIDETVTRGEFAQMLVRASDYRQNTGAAGGVSVFADVASL